MHPRTEELIRHLEDTRAVLRAALEDVPAVLRDTRPAPDRWSVAEVVEHLVLIETRVAAMFTGAVEAAKRHGLGKEDEISSVLEATDRQQFTDRTQRLEAPEGRRPSGGVDAVTGWSSLTALRGLSERSIRATDGLAIGTVSVPHPRFGPMSLYKWVAFIGYHELRHAEQIREIGQVLSARSLPQPSSQE
ncbi:MAG: DinB family protein [Acidobacteriota bacterium]